MELQSGLQLAVKHLSAGESQRALDMLSTLDRRFGNHPDILQIRGLALRRLGRLEEAISSFRASLALADRQPHTHNNLGSALLAAGNRIEAEKHYRRALALKPDYADAKYNLGLLLTDADPAAARNLLQTVTAMQPGNSHGWEALSIALGKLDEPAASLAAARQAVSIAPGSYTAQHNLGQAAMANRDFASAEASYVASLKIRPQSEAGWLGLANVLRSQERNQEAAVAAERAVAANPGNTDAHRVLNELLWQTGQEHRYLASYSQAIAMMPGHGGLRTTLAEELMRVARPAQALELLAPPLDWKEHASQVEDIRARAHAALGDFKHAFEHHARATALTPHDLNLARNHIETLLKAGRHDEALNACDRSLALSPHDQGILAMTTTALRLVGDERQHWLADVHTHARARAIEPPAGFGDIKEFNQTLAHELRKLHNTKNHPTDQTLRGGTQTFGALFDRREPLIQMLKTQLELVIADYIAQMPPDPTHPLFGRKAGGFGFSGSWSVRLKEGGFHTNHFHPKGWISSAYYVCVPDEAQDETAKPGWFKLGETNLQLSGHESIQRHVQPTPGTLVLFPSYFWHGTIPFNTTDERITVAFDVVPRA
jgi:tetratricopeptide (TPR) repeat protein